MSRGILQRKALFEHRFWSWALGQRCGCPLGHAWPQAPLRRAKPRRSSGFPSFHSFSGMRTLHVAHPKETSGCSRLPGRWRQGGQQRDIPLGWQQACATTTLIIAVARRGRRR